MGNFLSTRWCDPSCSARIWQVLPGASRRTSGWLRPGTWALSMSTILPGGRNGRRNAARIASSSGKGRCDQMNPPRTASNCRPAEGRARRSANVKVMVSRDWYLDSASFSTAELRRHGCRQRAEPLRAAVSRPVPPAPSSTVQPGSGRGEIGLPLRLSMDFFVLAGALGKIAGQILIDGVVLRKA